MRVRHFLRELAPMCCIQALVGGSAVCATHALLQPGDELVLSQVVVHANTCTGGSRWACRALQECRATSSLLFKCACSYSPETVITIAVHLHGRLCMHGEVPVVVNSRSGTASRPSHLSGCRDRHACARAHSSDKYAPCIPVEEITTSCKPFGGSPAKDLVPPRCVCFAGASQGDAA